MLAVIVNTVAVIVGSLIGMLIKKGVPESWSDLLMKGLGLCTMFIGIQGAMAGENILIAIISIVIGACIGQAIDIDKRLNNLGHRLENRFAKEGEENTIARGFVTASLLWCVGAMTIVGALQAGLVGDNQMLFTKSTLDFFSSIVLAASLGVGVLFASAFLFAFQGGIVLLAVYIAPYLGDSVVAEMTCAGSIIIIGIGINLIKAGDIKVANYLPAIFLPIGIVPLAVWLSGLF